MAERGAIARDEAQNIEAVLNDYETDGDSIMLTPGVFQIVARKRS